MSTGGRAWFGWPASGRPREPNKEEFEKVHTASSLTVRPDLAPSAYHIMRNPARLSKPKAKSN